MAKQINTNRPNSYKNFKKMVGEFASNWMKIKNTANKKQKILDQYK